MKKPSFVGSKKQPLPPEYGAMNKIIRRGAAMIYITGDTHRDFKRTAAFCDTVESTTDDVLIILGDAGINYFGGAKDRWFKYQLAQLPITLFCIHGNHEQRPETLKYATTERLGGTVYW